MKSAVLPFGPLEFAVIRDGLPETPPPNHSSSGQPNPSAAYLAPAPPVPLPSGTPHCDPDVAPDPEQFAKRVRPSKVKIFDPSREGNAGLPAITKMHLLKGGLEGRGFRAKRDDMQAAERFFAANSSWSVRHLLDVFDLCKKAGPAGLAWEAAWLSKKGVEFNYLLPNLRRILGQLNSATKFPSFVAVDPTELYPRRKNPRRPKKIKKAPK